MKGRAPRARIVRKRSRRPAKLPRNPGTRTSTQQLEDALRASEARLNKAQAIAHLGSWVLDLRSNTLSWSDEVYRIFGLKPQEFRATYEAFLEAVHPEDRAVVDAAYTGSLREGRDSYEIEHRIVRRSTGEIRTVHEKCEHLRDAAGLIVGSVGMVHDITDRKEAEEALRVSEAQLKAINERLREADRHKNEFLAMLSHELRNPLAAIRNGLFILQRAAPGSDERRMAEEVMDRQVGRLVRLVDDLLDVTRISRNKIHLDLQRLDLNELVRRTVADQRLWLEHNQLRLELALAEAPLSVMADRERLPQVVSNLLDNACKFTPPGGHVRVSVEADADAGRGIVRVADNGAGMPADVVSRVFEPFMQADHTLERSRGGLGLGLALAKGLVVLHGGEIAAQSDGVGKGSVFTMRLPLAPAGAIRPPAAPAAPVRSARHILIIEDDADAAETLRQTLVYMGHEVSVARSGVAGLAQARALRPDAILCDIGLPGMDGYEVARTIRGDDDLRDVLLLSISGYASPVDVERAGAAGFDEHLAKPPSLERLAALLGSVLTDA